MKALGLSPATVYALALLVLANAIAWISTRMLKRYIEYEERESQGRVIPGRYRR